MAKGGLRRLSKVSAAATAPSAAVFPIRHKEDS